MAKIKRIPQAPGQPIPELAEFLAQFQVHFDRKESQVASERYLTGLLTEHPNKHCDTIASVVPGTSEQSLLQSSTRAGNAHLTDRRRWRLAL